MQGKVAQLWTLMNRSQMVKSQFVFLFFIGIVEVAAGLAVPLLTMKLINQISSSGFAFTSRFVTTSCTGRMEQANKKYLPH